VAQSKASWYHETATGNAEEGTLGVTLRWVSGTLAAGTHTVQVSWASLFNPTGTNQIYFSTPNHNATRSITVQEIRSSLF
jgi:hypothetical protein